MYLGTRKFLFETLGDQLAVWLWAKLLTSLSLSFPSFKMGMHFRDVARIKSTQLIRSRTQGYSQQVLLL